MDRTNVALGTLFIALCLFSVLYSLFMYGDTAHASTGLRPEQISGEAKHDECWEFARKAVHDSLFAPATAQHCRRSEGAARQIRREGARFDYECSGWVDSQNSFGALIRSNWRVVVSHDGRWLRVVDANITSPLQESILAGQAEAQRQLEEWQREQERAVRDFQTALEPLLAK